MINNNKYNYDYQIKYMEITNEDESDTQYRRDILNVFNVEFIENIKYDRFDALENQNSNNDEINDELNLYKLDLFDIITERTSNIYNKLPKDNQLFNEICVLSANRLFSNDKETGFIMLFSYETFYKTHALLSKYFKNNILDNEIIKYIKQLLI